MVFSSLTFLFAFFPLSLLLYYAVPYRFKNFILLLTGLVFYGWGEPVYIIIMIISIFIDYSAGRIMDHFSEKPAIRKAVLLVSVVMNLGLLGVFKYSSFFISNINALFGTSLTDPQLPLPIGISFYTFQSMSYSIDLYRRQIPVQKNIINFGAYVTMFPQLVAGPIVRYEDVHRELNHRTITTDKIADGVYQFIVGLAKKVLLANNLGFLWTTIKALPVHEISPATAWIGILAFTFQIYFDFSGYSDMAIGMGKMMGFHFPQNFNLPYISKSISEFWRRWHITLGSWFREYVYIPLGGNRKGMKRTVINLLIVWTLTGFWHGASWNFLLWGLYFGVIIVAERLFLGKLLQKLPGFVQIFYSFFLVVLGWVLFEFVNLPDVWNYLGAMFGANGTPFIDTSFLYYLKSNLVVFALAIIISSGIVQKGYAILEQKGNWLVRYVTPVACILVFLLCTAYLVDSTYNPFLYFRF
ncbi:MAG TPA: MBOAT family protein [Candidatus Gallacutalibacter stercoravium]|nr:MBOAT family protein [Candidatus Gallacutalibacter stercoravium]